jgi:hypothetical protein
MKLGFWTGNERRERIRKRSFPVTDRFLNFTYLDMGQYRTVQFFNQQRPDYAAKMLRQLADKIEEAQ